MKNLLFAILFVCILSLPVAAKAQCENGSCSLGSRLSHAIGRPVAAVFARERRPLRRLAGRAREWRPGAVVRAFRNR